MSTAEIIAELPRLSAVELAQVQAKVKELVEPVQADARRKSIPSHPALGMWKDRTDLPDDSIEASKILREKMMHHGVSETHIADS